MAVISETTTAVESHSVETVDSETDSEESGADPQLATSAEPDEDDAARVGEGRRLSWRVVLAYVVLPALAVSFAVAAGYFGWRSNESREAGTARIDALAAAKDTTVALLSYKPDTAEKDLTAAQARLTGTFKDSYAQLTRDVVIPGAKQKQITATATVPAIASVSVTPKHVVALLYVNQTTVIGGDAPSDSVSTVRVTVDKVDGRWLVSEFDPI